MLLMNVDALRIFCEVARQRSFSGAGKKLRITQSAASQAVQNLERELECQLLDRSRRPPRLTVAGERFFEGCRDVLDRFDQTVVRLHELEDEVVGPVPVASIYSVGLYHTDEIRRFMEMYPKASIRLQFLRPNLVVSSVLQGDASLGLVSYPRETRELAVQAWRDEEMVLVCRPDHRLARNTRVHLDELQGEHFVAFDRDLIIRKRLDHVLQKHEVDVQIAMEFDNIETIKQAVQVGAGIAIVPEATVQHAVESGSLAAIHVDPAELVRPLGILYRKSRPLSLAAQRFVQLLTNRSAPQPETKRVPALPASESKPRRQTNGRSRTSEHV